MENITLFGKEGHENPRICVRRHEYAYTCSKSAYAYTSMCMHARVLETMKDKFFALKMRFGMNPTSFRRHSKPLFSHYIKPYIVSFQKIQKILRENLRFTRNSKSNREFFKKHPQVNFLLIGTLFGLDLRVLKFTNQFCLVVNRFD